MDKQAPPARILFAGGDSLTCEMARACFSKAGWDCDLAVDMAAAMRLTNERHYEVLLVSSLMRDGSGLELLKSMRLKDPDQAVIAITAPGNVAEMLAFLRSGASDILEEPLGADTLEKTVARVLSSVQRKEADEGLYRYVSSEIVNFEFTSAELAEIKLPLISAERLYRSGQIDLNTRLRLQLAFQEALVNSLEHGNLELKSDWKEMLGPDGKDRYSQVKQERLNDERYARRLVKIGFEYKRAELRVILEDEGRGFLFDSPQGVLSPDLHCYGRGLTVIKATMDEVYYEKNGTRLIMVKRLKAV